MALRAIGKRNLALNAAAVVVAQRLADSPHAAARWVGKDALREITSPAVTKRLKTWHLRSTAYLRWLLRLTASPDLIRVYPRLDSFLIPVVYRRPNSVSAPAWYCKGSQEEHDNRH